MRLELKKIGSPEAGSSADALQNQDHHQRMGDVLDEKRAKVRQGWGDERVHRKGKLTTWERIELLKDSDTVVHEVGTLVNWGRDFAGSKRQAPGAGVVTAFCHYINVFAIVVYRLAWCYD